MHKVALCASFFVWIQILKTVEPKSEASGLCVNSAFDSVRNTKLCGQKTAIVPCNQPCMKPVVAPYSHQCLVFTNFVRYVVSISGFNIYIFLMISSLRFVKRKVKVAQLPF